MPNHPSTAWRSALVVLAIAAGAAGASAHAQTMARPHAAGAPLRSVAAWTVRPTLRVEDLSTGVVPKAKADALAATLTPRTAVARSLGGDEVTGAIGFLCGRAPGHGDTGSAEAYGYDPQGRFVGAKLSYAF